MTMKRFVVALMLSSIAACGPPKAKDADEVLAHVSDYAGKLVTIKGRFRSGARCKLEKPDGKFMAYCKECQFCRGPVVFDTNLKLPDEGLDDWPLILGGTWKGKDIRCVGPLNQIECYPFTLGKTYIVQGQIEHQRPYKLLVERFWETD
jgi:hypothetical protein